MKLTYGSSFLLVKKFVEVHFINEMLHLSNYSAIWGVSNL
ncbi:hypothetical protein B4079_2222 [Bacillus cereus]|nr:hypothetical protein B4079_2222 [Bacillus cereus]